MISRIAACTMLLLCAGMALTANDELPPHDGGWPRLLQTPSGGEITLFEPQVANWEGQIHLEAFCAVSYLPGGASKEELGTIKFEATTEVSTNQRLVYLADLRFTESNFQTLSREQTREVVAEMAATFPDTARVIALDRLLAAVDMSLIVPKNLSGAKAEPPTIFYSDRPARLLILDGSPVWSPIKGNDLKFAVNTNWDLFQHSNTNILYLRVDSSWLQATQMTGPWVPASDLPQSLSKLPADDNWAEVLANIPGKKFAADKVPTIFSSLTPAELILTDGEPDYVPVQGTLLMWVSNCENDLFRMGSTGAVYILISGRWFSAPDYSGPWVFATPNLPEDFKRIPPEHERSHVLASIPGTDASAEAILLAQLPQTARVEKDQVEAPPVEYLGDPAFKQIEGTTCQHATNTDKDIIKVGDLYYMCFQGVWFMSRTATGPWEVTGDVPDPIYTIPPSAECYHVTYVRVSHYSPSSTYITFAYTSGYTGVYIAWGVPVYGTGWHYPPYVYWGYPYPVYYPRWTTYGSSVRYNPWTGVYASSAKVYGPYGGARFGAAYNPRTGTYARGAAVYGPYAASGAARAYNPRTGAYGATRQGSNAYSSWGTSHVRRGDQWAYSERYTNKVTGQTTRRTETSEGSVVRTKGSQGSATVARSGDDIYAGRDGNVYKKNDGGSWSKFDNGGWSSVNKPATGDAAAQTSRTADKAGRSKASGENLNGTKQATTTSGNAGKPAARTTETSKARQKSAASGTAGGTTASSRENTGTRKSGSTMSQLERDSRARSDAAKRAGKYSKQRSSTQSTSRGGRGR